eukprot:GFYU01007482.1.p1 GENE.GFYU01007482.1~~GFYU01007482.1.p1  ORF type:complete len:350 (-),score=73.56 GFYU01007482.1:43-1092(-)
MPSVKLVGPVVATVLGFVWVGIMLLPLVCGLVALAVAYHFGDQWYRHDKVSPGGKSVLVTGCDTGLGRMLAQQLVAEGFHVFALCLTRAGADDLKKQCSSNLTCIQGDVTKDSDIDNAVKTISGKCPGGLWAVVNNAGISIGGYCEMIPMSDYYAVMEVNLFGTVRVTKACIDLLRKGRGRVINVTSVAGSISAPKGSPYSMSKFAAEAFTNAIRSELEVFGISVVTVQPGFMRTPLVDGVHDVAKKGWDATPERIREIYGGEKLFTLVQEGLQKLTEGAQDPQLAVDAMKHAVTSQRPKQRYRAGNDARFIFFWVSKMPDWFIQGLFELLSPDMAFVRSHWQSKQKTE